MFRGGKGRTNPAGPDGSFAMVKMPDLSGVMCRRGPRPGAVVTGYTLDLTGAPQSAAAQVMPVIAAPVAAAPAIETAPAAPPAPSPFGLSARRDHPVQTQELTR
jgi:hypothetical protein